VRDQGRHEGGLWSARPGPRASVMLIGLRRRRADGPHCPPPSPLGFPLSKSNRWGPLPLVANPSSTAQRGGYSPLPVVGGRKEKKNTGVHAGVFFPGCRLPCLPVRPPPQRGVICPPVGASFIMPRPLRSACRCIFPQCPPCLR
jgi:hypothetical protein